MSVAVTSRDALIIGCTTLSFVVFKWVWNRLERSSCVRNNDGNISVAFETSPNSPLPPSADAVVSKPDAHFF